MNDASSAAPAFSAPTGALGGRAGGIATLAVTATVPEKVSLRSLTDRRQLTAVVGEDPFLTYDVVPRPERAWAAGTAVAVTRTNHRGLAGMSVWARPPGGSYDAGGLPDDAGRRTLAGLLEALLGPGGPEHGLIESVSVPLGCRDLLLPFVRLIGGGEWEWMVTRSEPASCLHEDAVVELDDAADAAELQALIDADNPLSEGDPGTGRSERWLGVRDGSGRIVACGARHRTRGGAPHLSGILVAAGARGRGLGRAVTTALTRESVRAEGVCTLGMYADNDTARRLYHSMGYVTAHAWASTRIAWE